MKSLSIKNLFVLTFFLMSAVLTTSLVGILKPTEVFAISTYTITFNANGGNGSDYTQTFNSGETKNLTENQFTRTSYTFVEWNTSSGGEGISYINGASISINSSFTLYAQWSENVYTITFDVNGGDELTNNTMEISYGDIIPTLPAPTRDGYAFTGWYYNSTYIRENLDTYGLQTNATLTASWAILYTITFEENGGTEIDNYSQAQGVEITEPTEPTKTGYTFSGWYTDNTTFLNEYTFSTMPNANTTLYAKWTANSYTITFNTNGGAVVQEITDDFNSTITLPTPTKAGYTFAGWFLDEDCTIPASLTTIPAENTTLYASWEAVSNNGIYYIIGGIALLIIGTLAIYFVAKPKKVKGSK